MKPNLLKKAWYANQPTINGWLSTNSAQIAEFMAEQHYDSLTVDLQHGMMDFQSLISMYQAMRASEVVPMVRVPWLDPAMIMKALDAGAYGIICPMINTAEQAAQLVQYVRYPPTGIRSFGPTRATISAGGNYALEADENILCLAMIETREAYQNINEITRTPGLDGIYIGPADLTLCLLGKELRMGFDREEPEMIEAILKILAAAKSARIRAGLHCGTPEYAAKAVKWGFDFVTISNDVRLLMSAAAGSIASTRALIEGLRQASDGP